MTDKYLLIPVEFAAQALKSHAERTHHLFLLLKARLPGYGYINKTDIKELSNYLQTEPRTVKKHLKKLVFWNYIGSDKDLYFIRSWERIRQTINFKHSYGVEWNIYKIEDPQALFAGMVIGRLALQNETELKKTEREPAQLQSQCASPGSTSSPILQPVADRALVSILGISKGKANKLKQKAYRAGFIDIVPNWKRLENDELKNEMTEEQFNKSEKEQHLIKLRDKKSEAALFKKVQSEYDGKIRIARNGRVAIREADLVTPNLTYKKGRNF